MTACTAERTGTYLSGFATSQELAIALPRRLQSISRGNMRLQNFEISSSIEFQSGGLFWDIHNFANFDGLELIRAENAAVMRWSVPPVSNPWGCHENKFAGMELHFKNLLFLHVGPRDKEMPMSEDTCVSAVLMVDPNIQHDEPYMRQVQEMTDCFRLLFQFQSARVIEIESEIVELRPTK